MTVLLELAKELLFDLWQFTLANPEVSLGIIGAGAGGIGWFGPKLWSASGREVHLPTFVYSVYQGTVGGLRPAV